jgi:serine phosphatase RsbU (regulator of sigma subunit)
VGVLVADVSGHGVPAALVASMVKVAARSHADLAASPARFALALNRTLCGHLDGPLVAAGYLLVDTRWQRVI